MIKVNTRPSPSRAAFRTLSRRYPSYFRIDYSKPVRHAYLPFGHQATLLYDTSYPLLHRLASYEQSQFELTGKVPSYCKKELNLSQNDYEHDLRADYFLEQQHRHLEDQERQHHHAQDEQPHTTQGYRPGDSAAPGRLGEAPILCFFCRDPLLARSPHPSGGLGFAPPSR